MVEAFWGSAPFQETSEDKSIFSTQTLFVRTIINFRYECVNNLFKNEYVTGAPGAPPVAGNPGLTMGIMGAPTPGAPGLHRDRQKEKETIRYNYSRWKDVFVCGTPKGVIIHHFPVMSRLVQGHYWTGLLILPCRSWGESP